MFRWLNSFWPLPLFAAIIIIIIGLIKKHKFFDWSPIIFAIFLIIVMIGMSLDGVSYGLTFGIKSNNFFSKNLQTSIPLFILLIISLKYELTGGIGFLLAGLFHIYTFGSGGIVLSLPMFIIGTLFLINWFKKQKYTLLRHNMRRKHHHI